MTVYVPATDSYTKQAVRLADRENAIRKFNYIQGLLGKKEHQRELFEWSQENLSVAGVVHRMEGLFGVVMVQIL